jgi:glutathione S-transferase
MITVFGGGISRSMRVTWLLEEMGIPYRVRPVDMLSSEPDEEFLAANPAAYIPVLRDGDVTMVESIAMMEYLMARYGPTPLAVVPDDAAYADYLQFLHLGEAGIATLLMPAVVTGFLAPEAERGNWTARWALAVVQKRLRLVAAQLARAPYMAGEAFTAADISMTFGLQLGARAAGLELGEAEQAYLARMMGRDGYKRALEISQAAIGA